MEEAHHQYGEEMCSDQAHHRYGGGTSLAVRRRVCGTDLLYHQ